MFPDRQEGSFNKCSQKAPAAYRNNVCMSECSCTEITTRGPFHLWKISQTQIYIQKYYFPSTNKLWTTEIHILSIFFSEWKYLIDISTHHPEALEDSTTSCLKTDSNIQDTVRWSSGYCACCQDLNLVWLLWPKWWWERVCSPTPTNCLLTSICALWYVHPPLHRYRYIHTKCLKK